MPELCDTSESCWPEHKDCDHRDYIGKEVTLNNLQAVVITTKCGYGYIKPIDPELRAASYPWIVIFNICDNHSGRFTSNFPL